MILASNATMTIRILQDQKDRQRYDQWLRSHPDASLWQSLEWKTYMKARGRNVRIYVLEEEDMIRASALTVIDRTSLGFSTWEIPRGPLSGQCPVIGDQCMPTEKVGSVLLKQIIHSAKRDKCIALYLSPPKFLKSPDEAMPFACHGELDVMVSSSNHESIHAKGMASARHIYPEATRIIDLAQSEENLLAQMHQKGRYNIRVGQKHGIIVKQSDDVDAFYTLLRDTGSRDSFTIHPKSHYEAFLKHLKGSFLLLAFTKQTCDKCQHDGSSLRQSSGQAPLTMTCRHLSEIKTPIAGLLGVIWGSQGIYYYGASSYASRALMAPYLVQWEAMRHCKTRGCETYDLLGVAPEKGLGLGVGIGSHPWAGISAFKEKFGGNVVTYPPEQQIILRPVVAKVLEWKRRILG